MNPSALIALITIITILLFVVFHKRLFAWIESWTSREYTRQVRAVWYNNWNGTEADRIAAWERTVNSLEAHDYPSEMVMEARLHLMAEIWKLDVVEASAGKF